MSSERKSAVVVFAVVALVVGGGAFYFFGVYRPKQEKSGARDEVTAWEKRWLDARACLVGDSAAAAKPGQALAIREMQPETAANKCAPLMDKLSRGEAPSTGIAQVEAAWDNIDKAAAKLGGAFARHVSSARGAHDPLPAAMDAFEDAREALRAAVDMPSADPLGPALPAAEMIALADGKDAVTKLDPIVPSAHGGLAFGDTKSHQVEVVLTAGGAPQVARVGPGEIRSVGDLGFGAVAGVDQLQIGAIDREGKLDATQTLELKGQIGLLLVVGTAKAGVVVYGAGPEMVFARADASQPSYTAGKSVAVATVVATVDPVTNRGAAVWTDPKGALSGEIVAPGVGTLLDLGKTGDPIQLCLTNDRAYATTRGALVSFTADKPAPSQLVASYVLRGCSPSAAILYLEGSRGTYSVCSETCRPVELAGSPPAARPVVAKNKLYAAAAHSGVIEVWREGGKPTYYAAGLDWIEQAMTDGKVIDLVGESPAGYAIARIPVP